MNALHAKLERACAPHRAAGAFAATVLREDPAGKTKELASWRSHAIDGAEFAALAYSITKTFYACLCLLLEEDGRLELEAPATRWLDGVPLPESVSLRALLDHSAGLPDYGPLAVYHEALRRAPSKPWTFERFIAETLPAALPEPRTWSYSNVGYMLVKRVLERASGDGIAKLIAARIAEPLGLAHTFVVTNAAQLLALVEAPSIQLSLERTPLDVRTHYDVGWVSHHVIASTPSELVRFLHATFSSELLSERSRTRMTTTVAVPQELTTHVNPRYGLGLMSFETALGRVWGHNGAGPGYTASVFHAPEREPRVTACMMSAFEDPAFTEARVLEILAQCA